MPEAKQHWNAEQTSYRMSRDHKPIWALVYDPTPGGRRNDDGTTSYSLRFPALILAEYVEKPEQIAGQIAAKLNAFDDILTALKDFVTETRAYTSPECEECEIVGPLLRAADAAIAKAEGRATAQENA